MLNHYLISTQRREWLQLYIVSDLHTKLLQWDNTLPQYTKFVANSATNDASYTYVLSILPSYS